MLGEQKSTFFTVKDLSAAEFIEAFAQYLKKNNIIERPSWVDVVKCSTRNISNIQATNSLLLKKTGSTTKWLPSPARSTSDPTPESNCFPTSRAAGTVASADPSITSTQAPRSSDGASLSSRSRNWSRRTRRETAANSTPASFPTKAEEPLTESPLSSSKTENDCSSYHWENHHTEPTLHKHIKIE